MRCLLKALHLDEWRFCVTDDTILEKLGESFAATPGAVLTHFSEPKKGIGLFLFDQNRSPKKDRP
jgi:hypothetical protein